MRYIALPRVILNNSCLSLTHTQTHIMHTFFYANAYSCLNASSVYHHSDWLTPFLISLFKCPQYPTKHTRTHLYTELTGVLSQQGMWVSQTPMDRNCYFLIKLCTSAARGLYALNMYCTELWKSHLWLPVLFSLPSSWEMPCQGHTPTVNTQSAKKAGWLIKSL